MKQKKIVLAAVAVVVLVALLAGVYAIWGPKAVQGEKTITVQVTAHEPEAESFTITTQAEFLRQALEEINLVQGDESEYGLFVKTVNGVTAQESAQEWWCFTKGGQDVMTGVDVTPIADGDVFEITLKTGW